MKKFLNRTPFLIIWFFIPIGLHAQSWLHMSTIYDYVDIGDLDVTGNQLTVEAKIYQQGSSYGDIVSKHSGPPDANYLLRPYRAEITTTNGFVATPVNCGVLFQYMELNACYHIAMVYDGSSLKHYINGELNAQAAITGNMVQNNLTTKIGMIAGLNGNQTLEQFYGYIDEVRIWNVARTQAELQTYKADTLPNPASQAGLVAYYRFDNLTNRVGSGQYDGSLIGTSSIANQDTFCSFLGAGCSILQVADSYTEQANIGHHTESEILVHAAENHVIVELLAQQQTNCQIRLMDLSGKILKEEQMFLSDNQEVYWKHEVHSKGMHVLLLSMNGKNTFYKIWI